MWEPQETDTEAGKVWRDSNSDIVAPVKVRAVSGAVTMRQRSLSLPAVERQVNYGSIPSLSSVQQSRTAWDRLGLYMKGLPSKHLKQAEQKKRQNIDFSMEDWDCLISVSVMMDPPIVWRT